MYSYCNGHVGLLLLFLTTGEDSERGSHSQTTEEPQESGRVCGGGEENGVVGAAQGVHSQVHIPQPSLTQSAHPRRI